MLGDNHLHVDRHDSLTEWVASALGFAKGGSIHIKVGDSEAASITANPGLLTVDLRQPSLFRIRDDDSSLFDKLKTTTELGRKLSDGGVTVAFLRNGKEAVRVGKGAHPTLSKVVTRSDDLQLSSVRQFAKLKGDLKSD